MLIFKKYLIFENYVYIRFYLGMLKVINLKLLMKYFGCLLILILYFWVFDFYSDCEVKYIEGNISIILFFKNELVFILVFEK